MNYYPNFKILHKAKKRRNQCLIYRELSLYFWLLFYSLKFLFCSVFIIIYLYIHICTYITNHEFMNEVMYLQYVNYYKGERIFLLDYVKNVKHSSKIRIDIYL